MITAAAPTIDPEFKAVVRPLSAEERSSLEQSILADGCRDPLVVWRGHGILLDGHHRQEICDEHGIDYHTTEIELSDRTAAKVWILRNQFSRRNLTPYERAELAVELEKILPTRQGERTDLTSDRNRSEVERPSRQAAETAGVAYDTFRKAKHLTERASDTTKEKLRRGETSINREFRLLTRAEAQRERADGRAAAVASHPTGSGIVTGDFREAGSRVADGSVDLIFTDPPYLAETVTSYRNLGEFASRVLRPGGLCLAYCGQFHLIDALNHLQESLEYVWMIAVRHVHGETRIHKWNLRNGWKPILVFGKPPVKTWWEPIGDVVSADALEKTDHEWQQSTSEASYYIQHLCPAGGFVVDPFCGSGTTLVAAKRLGRQFLGFEVDEGVAAAARKRLETEADG